MRFRTTLTGGGLLVLASLFASGSSLADANGPITFGDVMATFQASPIGFFTADDDSAVAVGTFRARIFPAPVPTDHCEGDWSVAMTVNFLPTQFFSKKDVAAILDPFSLAISLDGMEQTTRATAIKNAPTPFAFGDIWYRNTGFFIAPGSLSAGPHHVRFVSTEIATGIIVGDVTHPVEILPADDPACANGG